MSKKLYVGNLPFAAEEAQLSAHFGADGRQVAAVKILVDKQTGRSRGFGFVEMSSPEDASRAIEALHGKEFLGRPISVSEARDQVGNGAADNPTNKKEGAGRARAGY